MPQKKKICGATSKVWIRDHKKMSKWSKVALWVGIVSLVLAVLAVIFYILSTDCYIKWRFKPNIKILSEQKDDSLLITIKVKKNNLESFAIDYPIKGVIQEIRELNGLIESDPAIKQRIGNNFGEVTNNAEIKANNISENSELQYFIKYQPKFNGYIASFDRYEMMYKWEHDGKTFNEREWRTVADNKITTAPDVTDVEVQKYDRILSDKEIQRISEPNRNVTNF